MVAGEAACERAKEQPQHNLSMDELKTIQQPMLDPDILGDLALDGNLHNSIPAGLALKPDHPYPRDAQPLRHLLLGHVKRVIAP